MCHLESLPADVLSYLLERCSQEALARLALTNRQWATRIQPVVLVFWERLLAAQHDVQSVQSFDELAAFLAGLARDQQIVAWIQNGTEFDIDLFQNAEDPPSARLLDWSLETAKRRLVFQHTLHEDQHTLHDRFFYGGGLIQSHDLAVAITARLPPAGLREAFDQMMDLPHLDLARPTRDRMDVITIITRCLEHNVHRGEWTIDDLVSLATVAWSDDVLYVLLSAVSYSEDVAFAQTRSAAAAQLRPPAEVSNQLFWFNFLCGCIEDHTIDTHGELCHYYSIDLGETATVQKLTYPKALFRACCFVTSLHTD